jgi:hypothetical protein
MACLRSICVFWAAFLLALAGCASHAPTVIGPLDGTVVSSLEGKHIDFVVSPHYLGSVDDPTDTSPSKYSRDQALVTSVVASVLSSYDSAEVGVVQSAAEVTKPYVCEMKIHQFVGWIEILYAILPIPHSSNESICVTAVLSKQGQALSEYSECGFSRERGFWAWSGPDRPPIAQLRTFVTKKVVYQVLTDLAQH